MARSRALRNALTTLVAPGVACDGVKAASDPAEKIMLNAAIDDVVKARRW